MVTVRDIKVARAKWLVVSLASEPASSIIARMKIRALVLILSISATLAAQTPPAERHIVKQASFRAIWQEYSGETARENVRRIIEYHRIQGSPMMVEVAEKVVLAGLKQAGLEAAIEQFPSDGKTKYQTYISPMGWEIRGGELWVEGVGGQKEFVPFRLCRFSDIPMCVSTYSKGGEWTRSEERRVGKECRL